MAIIVTIFVLGRLSRFHLFRGMEYYFILWFFLLLLLIDTKNYKVKINKLLIWMIIAAFISVFLNDIPSFFVPYQRLTAFILTITLIGPIFYSTVLIHFRRKLFWILNNWIIFMVIASFIGLILGLPFIFGPGGFTGLFNQSMVLGPFAAIALIVSLYYFYTANTKSWKWIYILIALACFLSCIASASRGAILAVIMGILIFFYKIYQKKLSGYLLRIIVLIVVLVISYPLWQNYTGNLMNKISRSQERNGITTTRDNLWSARIAEFNSSPIIGIGFSAVDTRLTNRYDPETGVIEPGSSWLVILSMTGLLGFIPILILISSFFFMLYKSSYTPKNALYIGILMIFIIHMIPEGYVFSSGSGQFFYFWLLLGVIQGNFINSKSTFFNFWLITV